ncbi:MAG: CvpA family protein [Clostridia bacterium]|nr:CvpA family protein [Clostridia bacterium]
MEILPFVIDGILILILVATFFDGRRKGFFKMLFSLVATAIAVIIAYEYSAPLVGWVNEAFVQKAAVNILADSISAHLSSGTQAVLDSIPDYITEAAQVTGTSVSDVISDIGSSFDVVQAAELIYGGIYSVIVFPILMVVAFIVIYAISNAILSLGVNFLNNIFRLPVLKGLNKFFGGILGAFKGVVIVVILSMALVVFAPIITPEEIREAIDSSIIPNLIEEISIKIY